MVRLNKNRLSQRQIDQLCAEMNSTLGKLPVGDTGSFLQALFGPEERIMYAKRLAIIVMLNEGYSLYKISNTLKVSSATAKKIKYHLDHGDYQPILSALQKNKKGYGAIIDLIESILTVGGIMPHYGQARL